MCHLARRFSGLYSSVIPQTYMLRTHLSFVGTHHHVVMTLLCQLRTRSSPLQQNMFHSMHQVFGCKEHIEMPSREHA